MRPSSILILVLSGYVLLYGLSFGLPGVGQNSGEQAADIRLMQEAAAKFGLSDLALSTEARYTRHPAVSDPVVVTMDHPGALDHFPSTLFWAPGGCRP
ncbi:MAG: hypothetical protein A2X81_00505 [Desulfobacterales bacterium GWB2_56_26]|nr:MAG: hypothetical protein A2X81_00505 [Desulfobacterales bacterium GWB2_56_26]